MNKNKVLPIVGLLLLLGSIVMALYFKNVERRIIKEDNNAQPKIEEKVEIISEDVETKIDPENDLNDEMVLEIEEIETLDQDLMDLENLINDSILSDIDSDLSNF
ncbi:hypothetical protein KAJ41_00720 [Candidatus Parcubacteria bacterium]|nr:hypothetical protein [Candidatus Parcubacteria bacterium]